MTRLTYRKEEGPQVVKRELAAVYAGKSIIVELQPELIIFRLKGKRTRYILSAVTALEHAIRIEAARLARQKQLEREQKRKARKQGLL